MPSIVNIRNATITCNNYTDEPEAILKRAEESAACTFLVFSKELSETGTPHYQAYAEFSRAVRFAYINKIFGSSCHVETRRGTQAQAIAYCQKEDTHVDGPWQYGTPKRGSAGTRTDLHSFRDAVREGAPLRELLETHPGVLARHPRFYDLLRMQYNIEPRSRFRVILLYGPPGLGKTRYVYDTVDLRDLYSSPVMGGGFWLDGYAGEPNVLLDDHGPSKISRTNLLRLLDRYPVKAPVKGGFTLWNPEVIWITSNLKPQQWYDWTNDAHWLALVRRIHEIKVYSTEGVVDLQQGDAEFDEFMSSPIPPIIPAVYPHLPYN